MRGIRDRCWEDEKYFWYDAPLNGYRMPKVGIGICRDDGASVSGTEDLRARNLDEFASIVLGMHIAGRRLD